MEPFPHMVIEDLFPTETYQQLTQDVAKNIQYEPLSKRGTTGYPERSTSSAPSFLSWMTQGRLRDVLDAKFGIVSKDDEILLLRDQPGYKIPPHTDTPGKAVTMLVYLGDARHGTTLYTPKQSGFTDQKGLHHKWEQFDEYQTLEGTPNSALIFARTDTSFHGTKLWNGPGVRDVLLYDSKRGSC